MRPSPSIGLPYMGSTFGVFLLRQIFKSIPQELEDAARVEGANILQILWKVYVPRARPVYVAYGLVSISHHWNNFLWSVITAATLLTSGPLLIAFLLFQRQFVQSFMRTGIE